MIYFLERLVSGDLLFGVPSIRTDFDYAPDIQWYTFEAPSIRLVFVLALRMC